MDATPPTKTPAAGGCLIAIGIILGAAYGIVMGHAMVALLTGVCVGIASAVAVWLTDRR